MAVEVMHLAHVRSGGAEQFGLFRSREAAEAALDTLSAPGDLAEVISLQVLDEPPRKEELP